MSDPTIVAAVVFQLKDVCISFSVVFPVSRDSSIDVHNDWRTKGSWEVTSTIQADQFKNHLTYFNLLLSLPLPRFPQPRN